MLQRRRSLQIVATIAFFSMLWLSVHVENYTSAARTAWSGARHEPPKLNGSTTFVQANGDVTPRRDRFVLARSHQRPFTIGVVSSCLQSNKYDNELSQASLANKQEYCDRHEYVNCFLHNVSVDSRFSPQWNKFPLLSKSLRTNDVVVWMDCDAIFLNMTLTFKDIGLLALEKDVVLTKDHNGVNTGVFAVKRTAWAENFLSMLYAQRVSVDYFNSIGKGSGFVDQQGLTILREKYFSKDEFTRHVDLDPSFTQMLNNYCTSGALIHHRVNCNSKECNEYFSCLTARVRDGGGLTDCIPPEHLKRLCSSQQECCHT